jgi:K+-sensing histidine kinase KdpD
MIKTPEEEKAEEEKKRERAELNIKETTAEKIKNCAIAGLFCFGPTDWFSMIFTLVLSVIVILAIVIYGGWIPAVIAIWFNTLGYKWLMRKMSWRYAEVLERYVKKYAVRALVATFLTFFCYKMIRYSVGQIDEVGEVIIGVVIVPAMLCGFYTEWKLFEVVDYLGRAKVL